MDRQSEVTEQQTELRGLTPKNLTEYLSQMTTLAMEDLELDSEKATVENALHEITLQSNKPVTTEKISDRDRLYDTEIGSKERFPNPESRRPSIGEYPGFHISQPRPDGSVLHIYVYGGLRDYDVNLRDGVTSRQKGNDSASQTEDILSQPTNFRFEVTDERGNKPTSHMWIAATLIGHEPGQFKMAESGNRVLNRDILIPPQFSDEIREETQIVSKVKQTLNQRPR